MDVSTILDGQRFIWDSDKATSNLARHAISFDVAREALLDPRAFYEDASPLEEVRHTCIGVTRDYRLLFVNHVLREGEVIRLISARVAEPAEGDAMTMKMSDRIKRNMQPNKPMTMISLRLPEHVIDDLKEVAPLHGFGGYQALIKAYISNGLRDHLAKIEAQRANESAVESFSERLIAHGVPAQTIQQAMAEMKLAG